MGDFNWRDSLGEPSIDIHGDTTKYMAINASADFQIYANDTWYVRIKPDGDIEINPEITLTEAAQRFWDAVRRIRQPI